MPYLADNGVSPAEPTLGNRVAEGGLWLLTSRFAQHAASLIQAAVLARYLSPRDFGVFGIANLTMYALGVFVYTGFDSAIVQKPKLLKSDVDTTWWVLLARYAALMLLLLALAHPIAAFFQAPEAVPVLLAVALIQPIHGLAGPSVFLLRREMRFRAVMHIEAGGALAGLVVGIAAALLLKNVWALVIAYGAGACAVAALSYIVHPARPAWRFDPRSARELLSYGQWLTGTTIVGFICLQGASSFSGWMFGVSAMGVYQMTARFTLMPVTQVGETLQSALIPAFAAVQADAERVKLAFLRAMRLSVVMIVTLTAVLFVCLRALVPLLLGEQWSGVIPLAPWVAVAGGCQALLRAGTALHLGTGRPKYQFFIDLTQAVVLAALLYPLGRMYGMLGLPMAITGGAAAALPVWWWSIRRAAPFSLDDLLRAAGPPVAAFAAMASLSWIAALPSGPLSHPAFGAAAPLLGYAAVLAMAERFVPRYDPFSDLLALIRERQGCRPAPMGRLLAEPARIARS